MSGGHTRGTRRADRAPQAAEAGHLYADAAVYDVLHRPGTGDEVDALLRIARRHLGHSAGLRWLEPACGSGRYLIELARRKERGGGGHTGVGVDLEPGMVAYAQAAAERAGVVAAAGAGGPESVEPRLRFVAGRMERLSARMIGSKERFDAAFCLINSFRHLMTEGAAREHLRRVLGLLKPGGVYVVGVDLFDPVLSVPSEDVWEGRGGRGGRGRDDGPRAVRVKQFVSYSPPTGAVEGRARREEVYSHLTITWAGGNGGGGGRERDGGTRVEERASTYVLRTYTAAQWAGLLRGAGARAVEVCNADGEPERAKPVGYQLWVLSR
jgi:SAM-dependent methyltransferase